jgi:hypothetical protein
MVLTMQAKKTFKQVIANLRDILMHSDSYLFELFVGALHLFILPLAILEVGHLWHIQLMGVLVGAFQLYAVGMKDIYCRYKACQFAFILAAITVVHYAVIGMMHGSHLGWALVAVMSLINLIRTFKEKIYRGI